MKEGNPEKVAEVMRQSNSIQDAIDVLSVMDDFVIDDAVNPYTVQDVITGLQELDSYDGNDPEKVKMYLDFLTTTADIRTSGLVLFNIEQPEGESVYPF